MGEKQCVNLPIVTRASELWLLGQTRHGWRTWRRFPLGRPPW
jgi:hypothetical protein